LSFRRIFELELGPDQSVSALARMVEGDFVKPDQTGAFGSWKGRIFVPPQTGGFAMNTQQIEAIGVAAAEDAAKPRRTKAQRRAKGGKPVKRPAPPKKRATAPKQGTAKRKGRKAGSGRRTGTKQELLILMLKRAEGVTIEEVVRALGWQAHTVRGAMSGALKKKLGLKIDSEKVEGRGRVYRIAD
jgi:hypothetical protein